MITASHNPKEFNGFKVALDRATIYGPEIQKVQEIADRGGFPEGRGELDQSNPIVPYVGVLADKIKLKRRLKLAFDTGNGTAGPVIEKICMTLGIEAIFINQEPDGNFPNHLPDPTIPEYMQELIDVVRAEKLDLGIGFDGDGDRIGVIDEKGNIIWGDTLLAILAKRILKARPGSKVVFEVKCSEGLGEFVKMNKGVPIMYKTGHSLIKAKMKQEGALIAGEMSGHIFIADDYYGYDDAMYAALRLLELLSDSNRSLSQLAGEVPKYFSTPEIRVPCADEKKFGITKRLRDHFSAKYPVIDIDGVRVKFNDGWGLVRASNTQPVLVMRFEAKTEKRLKEIRQEFEKALSEHQV
jgi:phosphomannomutase/phosphoglucomutase